MIQDSSFYQIICIYNIIMWNLWCPFWDNLLNLLYNNYILILISRNAFPIYLPLCQLFQIFNKVFQFYYTSNHISSFDEQNQDHLLNKFWKQIFLFWKRSLPGLIGFILKRFFLVTPFFTQLQFNLKILMNLRILQFNDY